MVEEGRAPQELADSGATVWFRALVPPKPHCSVPAHSSLTVILPDRLSQDLIQSQLWFPL